MKFRLLLWGIGLLLNRARKKNVKFQEKLQGKQLDFVIGTMNNQGSRFYRVNSQEVLSQSDTSEKPKFSLLFKDAETGYNLMRSPNMKTAFMGALQNGELKIEGDSSQFFMFQDLMRTLKGKKKPEVKKD